MKYVPTFESFMGSQKLNENEDPHGGMDVVIVSPKGTKLKYAWFTDDMGYSAPVCNANDIPALEEFFLGGKKPSTNDENPLEMSDVYSEYMEDDDGRRLQEEKFKPLCKALKCKYRDLVFFELIHGEADFYTEDEYEEAIEKDQEMSSRDNSANKSFSLKGF